MDRTPSSRELALLLSSRLALVVPDGIVVTADGADVVVHVQDAVAEATTEPWPRTGTGMPMPGADVHNGRLLAWFGDRGAPALVIVDEADVWPTA